jgi:glycosyltransferase involved in cell wall biosynthesis
MRIAIVNKFVYLTGGADRHCLGLAAILRQRGHEVAFLATESKHNLERDGVFVHATVTHQTRDTLPLPARGGVLLKAFWSAEAAAAMRRLISSFKPDVVHVHKLYPALSVSPLVEAVRAGIPIVQTLHDFELISASALDARGGWFDSYESRFSYRALNSATFPIRRQVHVPRVTAFVSVSRFIARVAAAHGIESTVIPNFVPPGADSLPDFEERRGIVFIGRLRPEKGVLDVVELARVLPDIPVTIVGSGALADRIDAQARTLQNLTVTGFGPDVASQEIIRSARVIVIPSRCYEPGPLVSLEAMSHGTPAVVYANGGLAEYVSDAGSGLLVPPDVQSLARACSELHEDEAMWTKLSQNGLAAAAGAHSLENYGERIEQIYADQL